MNRYQKQRSKEIKQLVKFNDFGLKTYSQARRYWNWWHRYISFSPCDYCCNACHKYDTKQPIAYCPILFTVDMKLNRALRLLPQGITTK